MLLPLSLLLKAYNIGIAGAGGILPVGVQRRVAANLSFNDCSLGRPLVVSQSSGVLLNLLFLLCGRIVLATTLILAYEVLTNGRKLQNSDRFHNSKQ